MNHPQTNHVPPSEQDVEVWSRVFARRKSQWSQIDKGQLQRVVTALVRKGDLPPVPNNKEPQEQLAFLVQELFEKSIDNSLSGEKRRYCHNVIMGVFVTTNKLHDGASLRNGARELSITPLNMEIQIMNNESANRKGSSGNTDNQPIWKTNKERENVNSNSTERRRIEVTSLAKDRDSVMKENPNVNNRENSTGNRGSGNTQNTNRKRKMPEAMTSDKTHGASGTNVPVQKRPTTSTAGTNDTRNHVNTTTRVGPPHLARNQTRKESDQSSLPASQNQRPSNTNQRQGRCFPFVRAPPPLHTEQVVDQRKKKTKKTKAATSAKPQSRAADDTSLSINQNSSVSNKNKDTDATKDTLKSKAASVARRDSSKETSGANMGGVLSTVAVASTSNAKTNNAATTPTKSTTNERVSTPTPAEPPSKRAKPSTIVFQQDDTKPFKSGALQGRGIIWVNIENNTALDTLLAKQFKTRLMKWEPFWTTKQRPVVTRTSDLVLSIPPDDHTPMTAADCTITLTPAQANTIVSWGKEHSGSGCTLGEYRLLLRMLPLTPPQKKKRSDTHLFPKGTFVQVNGRPIDIVQRKQQSHDATLWKGMCHVLDLTPFIKNPHQTNKVQLLCQDKEHYAICVATCKYNSVETLLETVQKMYLRQVSLEESKRRAVEHIRRQTVVLDSDEGDATALGSLTFSLVCPISKTLIQIPVRGNRCKHFQCFDLYNYLSTNKNVSGSRWRCGVCEEFISCRDLQTCGLYQQVLEEFATDASVNRHVVLFDSNGKWKLVEQRKKRHSTKRPSPMEDANNNVQQGENGTNNNNNNKRAKHQDAVVIDLD